MLAVLGWIALLWSLPQVLDVQAVFLVLAALAVAESLGHILTATGPAPGARVGNVTHVLMGWVACAAVMVTGWHLGLIPLFVSNGYALACLAGLVLVLPLSAGLVRSASLRMLLSARWILLAGLMIVMERYAETTAEIALAIALLVSLILLAAICHEGDRPALNLKSGAPLPVWSSVDIAVLPLLLSPEEARIYLISRGLAQLPLLCIAYVADRASNSLTPPRGTNRLQWLAPRFARLNLGVMLVGGGAAMAVLALASELPKFLPAMTGVSQDVTLWLVLGASGTALFGAGDFAFRLLRWDGFRAAATIIRAVVFLLCLLAAPEHTAHVLALAFALAHLTADGVSALLLIRYGAIWPGLTALFLRKIRLF